MLCPVIYIQIDAIVEDFGLVVISRSGSSPEKFIYESDQLSRLQANTECYIPQLYYSLIVTLFCMSLSLFCRLTSI